MCRERDVTSSESSSTLAQSISNSFSIISIKPFSLASFTSISCPVICCMEVANRSKKTRQLSSLTRQMGLKQLPQFYRALDMVKNNQTNTNAALHYGHRYFQ